MRRRKFVAAPGWLGYPASMQLSKVALLGVALAMAGCSSVLSRPTESPVGDLAPVNLRQFQIIRSADGSRTVMLRLSRTATLVRHSSSSSPGRILVEAWGPAGDGDLAERSLPRDDADIGAVRVSRKKGELRLTLEFRSPNAPAYTVHEMADWIMIRLGQPG